MACTLELVDEMIDELGARLDDCYCGRVYVWTGTRAGGLRDDDTCSDWAGAPDDVGATVT